MSQGWIKLHRKIVDWEWYCDIPTKIVFLHLLLTANHETKNWRGVDIHTGEGITSIQNLANEVGLSFQQTKTAINKLKSTNDITIKTTTKYTLFKLNKYKQYQIDNLPDKQQINNEQLTNQPTNNYKQENKEIKNIYIYLNDQKFSTAFDDYLEMRQKIKKPATEKAKEMILKKLHEHPAEDATKMLEQSIINSWQGIFPLKEQNKNQNKNSDGVVTCHDGTQAVLYFGRWVDANNKNIAMDLHYYPELAKL